VKSVELIKEVNMYHIDYRLTLNNGIKMPLLGLGVYKITEENEVNVSIQTAVDAGYRLIDTASVYKNEEGVGHGIKDCSVPREELFITTKVWNTAQRLGDIEGAFERSLERLQLDYVDLYLIHWPVKGCYQNTWKEMEKIYKSGKAKAIGVSNFNIHHLEDIIAISDIIPAVNQFEFHPLLNQMELVDYCHANGIIPQAYSPLARGAYFDREILIAIGSKYGKSPAQIGLRWAIQRNVSIIPKSCQPERIISNADIFDFTLTDEELSLIDTLNENYRISSDPETFDF
jgi:diketogulonate reductase-like aldo/keto reductase